MIKQLYFYYAPDDDYNHEARFTLNVDIGDDKHDFIINLLNNYCDAVIDMTGEITCMYYCSCGGYSTMCAVTCYDEGSIEGIMEWLCDAASIQPRHVFIIYDAWEVITECLWESFLPRLDINKSFCRDVVIDDMSVFARKEPIYREV